MSSITTSSAALSSTLLRAPTSPPDSFAHMPTVMLAGNPNAGKTSLFNALTGLRQKVANYPGVTVERVEGRWQLPSLVHNSSHAIHQATNNGKSFSSTPVYENGFVDDDDAPLNVRVIDLPGLYSLDALSPDEQIARQCLAGEIAEVAAPDCIIAVVDATNLERNLFLVTQLLDYRKPLVVALTMFDTATRRRAMQIDTAQLSKRLGVPVVPVIVSEKRGLDELASAVRRQLAAPQISNVAHAWQIAQSRSVDSDASADEWLDWQQAIAARYAWIEESVAEAVKPNQKINRPNSFDKDSLVDATTRIDRFVTHRFFGPAIFLLLMLIVFQSIFAWAELPMTLIDEGFGALGDAVRAMLPAGLFADLIVDGVIKGVGGVLVFLPQICLLFLFIALLEDTGYMARAAFIMDRLMRGVGLHGKAFVPLLSSFACAIPGIMATRTIGNRRDRIATIMIAPLMSCSARLPVYTLMIAAFFANRKIFGVLSLGAIIIMSMYALGIVTAIIVATLLKRTILRAPAPPLVMELPPYRLPRPSVVLQTVFTRAWMFVRRAGTVILAISIVLWALVTFPRTTATTIEMPPPQTSIAASQNLSTRDVGTPNALTENRASGVAAASAAESSQIEINSGAQLRNSFAGRIGRFIEPAIAPLGFDWRTGVGLIASFAAREVFVSTMSIVYNVGADASEQAPSLIEAFHAAKRDDGSPAWTPLTAISLMVFFVLACQCMSTVAIVRRETNSWAWAFFMIGYMMALAYVASLAVFQGGRLLGFV